MNRIVFAFGDEPFGLRPFYPYDPVGPVQFSFKYENPFLFLPFLKVFIFDQTGRLRQPAAGLNADTKSLQ